MRHTAGFSLVEVMCAVLILGIGVAGLTQGLSTALSSSKESELQSAAALLAAGQMEMVRADGYLTDGDTDGDFNGPLSLYRWKQTITSTSIDGLHDVTVTIENTKTGKLIYELRTLLFDPPYSSTEDAGQKKKDDPSSRKEKRGL